MTPAGIEPATFRSVAQHLNHCATAVPVIKNVHRSYSTRYSCQVVMKLCLYRPFTAEARVRTQVSPCGGILDGKIWHWDKFSSKCSTVPLSVTFHPCSAPVFTYMLLLPEGNTGEAWAPFTKQCSFGYQVALHGTLLSYCFHARVLIVAKKEKKASN